MGKINTPPILLPAGGGAVKGIGETLQPSAFSGTASYSVQLPATSGRKLTPSLDLSYQSGGGNGSFGIGWDLSLPVISIRTEKGVPRYNESDVFMLSGQELVRKKGDSLRTETDMNGDVWTVIQYLPRVESSYTLIERWMNTANADCYWRTITTNNTISVFGKSKGSRISNPADNTRIFSWLIESTTNPTGDKILFQYKAENLENIDGYSARSLNYSAAQKYIKSIRYGNYFQTSGEEAFAFEVVFDYGEHDLSNLDRPNTNPYAASYKWNCRPDPFSSFRSAFEIRTYRLCQNVLLFHRFENEYGGKPFLVYRTALNYYTSADYQNHIDQTSIISCLKTLTVTGCRIQGDDSYQMLSKPALDFTFSIFDIPGNSTFNRLETVDGELPGQLEENQFLPVDLKGEGLSGLLYTKDGGTLYFSPLGKGRYASPELLPFMPVENSGYIVDLNGNGRLDMMVAAGYYEKNDIGWDQFKAFEHYPVSVRNVEAADLAANGRTDLLQIGLDTLTRYPSLGTDGYATPELTPLPEGFPLQKAGYESELVTFADVFGDGLMHRIRISNGLVECWPSLGYGFFGDKITLANAPYFEDDLNVGRLFLADLNGTGATDIIYAEAAQVKLYLNQSGNSFSDPVIITLPEPFSDLDRIQFADLLGRGTSSMIFTKIDEQPRHYYLNFSGEISSQGHPGTTLKPYMLVGVENNMGGSLQLHYSSSVKFYLDDKKAGKPWLTSLHFPVQVVDRITQLDEVSGSCYVQEFSYHDGYYDPVERSFCGFGFVETWDTQSYEDFKKTVSGIDFPVARLNEDLYTPPVYIKSWYNTGAFTASGQILTQYRQQFFQGDAYAYPVPDNVFSSDIYCADAETFRQAYAALKGTEIRTEIYALDKAAEASIPYAVEQSNMKVVLLQEKEEQRFAVFRVQPREHIAYHYERNASDPRVEQHFTLEVDPLSGQVKTDCKVYLTRRPEKITGIDPHPEQIRVQATISQTDYINTDYYKTNMYWRGIVCENKEFELTNISLGSRLYMDFDTCKSQVDQALQHIVPYGDGPQLDIFQAYQYSWQRSYFWDEKQVNIEGLCSISSRGLLAYSESAQFTQKYIDDAYQGKLPGNVIKEMGGYIYDKATSYWWNKGVVQHYFDETQPELFFLLRELNNPFADPASELSVKAMMGYNGPYNMIITELSEYVDPANDIKNTQFLDIDYITAAPRQLTDVNGNLSQVIYDPLGQVTVSSLFGIKNGQLEGGMILYPYQQFGAEYIARATDPEGKPITLDSVISNPEYYLQGAQSFFFYDEHAWTNGKQPVCAADLIRNTFYHCPDAQVAPYCQTRIEYTGGLGRVVEQKEKTDPGTAWSRNRGHLAQVQASDRWRVSGRSVFNNKGLVVEQYLPYFSDNHHYETRQESVESGAVPPPSVFHYDALGRIIRIDDAKGFYSKTTFTAWDEHLFDKDDTVLDSDFYKKFMGSYPQNPTQKQKDEKDALDKAAKFFNTPFINVFDNAGIKFLHIVNNLGKLGPDSFDGVTGKSKITSRQIFDQLIARGYVNTDGLLTTKFTPYKKQFKLELDPQFAPLLTAITGFLLTGGLTTYLKTDVQSRIVLEIDPRLYYSNQSEGTDYYNLRSTYEMDNTTPLVTDSVDAGGILHFDNLFGLQVWTWTPRNYNQLITYDRLQRKTSVSVKRIQQGDAVPPPDQYPLVERFTYRDDAGASEFNLRARLVELKDLSGIVTYHNYDLIGLPVRTSRQLTSVYKDAINWREDIPLEKEIFTSVNTYNARGLITSAQTPDGTLTKTTYNLAGLMTSIGLVLADGTSKAVVKSIDYNASSQRNSVIYANTSATYYTYEATTQRLLTQKSTRPAKSPKGQTQDTQLQNISYTYDPVGNITRMRDFSRDTVFYNNQKVEPLSDYTYDALYRLIAADGYQHPGILANTYRNNIADGDFKQSNSAFLLRIVVNWKLIMKTINMTIQVTLPF